MLSSRAARLPPSSRLFSFGQRTGNLPLNVGAAVKLPARKDTLAERILTEPDVHRLLALEPSRRNQVVLRLTFWWLRHLTEETRPKHSI
jgi:integrase/recombinase XerD